MYLKEFRKKIDEYGGPKISRADYLKKGKEYHSNQSQAECASEDDFKPHMMYDPKTGKGVKANTYADHVKYDKMGYTHEKPEVSEARARPPKIKKGLRDKKGKLHTVDMKLDGSKLSFRVTDEFGSFKVVNTKQLAKMFEGTDVDKFIEEARKPVSQMTPAEKKKDAERRKEYNAYQKSKREDVKEQNCGCGKTPCETYGNVDEAMNPKDKAKRLKLIKKAVERINKNNAEKAKKDALKMMKDSGMFDESVELEEKWKMGDGRPRNGARIENDRFWNLPKKSLEFIRKDASDAMKANPKGKKAGKYADEVNDAETVLGWRKKNSIRESVEITEAKQSYVDQMRDIVAKKSAKKINGVMVDMFTASAVVKVYDAINDTNKAKMDKMTVPAMANVAFKLLKK